MLPMYRSKRAGLHNDRKVDQYVLPHTLLGGMVIIIIIQ